MVSISDAIRTFGNMLGAPPSDSGLCGFQTFLKIFGGTASFAWITIITYVMYKLLLQSDKWDKFKLDRYKLYFHLICWLFAFLNAIIPSAGGFYANTSAWCFIEQSEAGIILRLFCYYLWVVLVWFIIIYCYLRIWKYIKQNNIELSSIPTVSKLLYYPLIFFFCWFWSLLRRAWNVFSINGEAPLGIIGLQIFFGNLYGFANAMLYGYIVRYHLKAASQSISDQSRSDRDKVISNTNTNIDVTMGGGDSDKELKAQTSNEDEHIINNKTDPDDDNL